MNRRFILPAVVALATGLLASQPLPAEAGLFDMFRRNPDQAAPAPPADLDPGSAGQGGDAMPIQSSSAEAQAALRMDRVEQQMRMLTGQVEELTYQVRQLQDQLRSVQPGGAKRAAPVPAPAPSPRAAAPAAAVDPVGAAIAAQTDVPDPSAPGAPPRPLGQIAVDPTIPQPLDLSAAGSGAATVPPAQTGSSRGDYDAAYELILKGDYDVAETSFQRFLASYPGDPLAPDAQYWIGESLFARQDYRGSADAFLAGYQQYPKSSKAPDMLLKLGLSLNGLGQREAACGTFGEILKKYPKASNALIQRVKAEQASASC
ncbi:tol-pal system protein YbgF [Kaistia algarum]|uniref:tol-pal system protein YbgF n=1 Tax=Kaistia algarum TaxID=2083279 RepID=UPI00140259B5|nr:tol-pal system protein YbgF [Kaistia algarum]MCX5516342.1 tol-pal system protein YbgF [Kaistia algarum]